MKSRRLKSLGRMCLPPVRGPHRILPKWRIAVRGSVACFAVRRQTRGIPLLAHRVESLRCERSDAIGAKRTCRERRKRVDLTKMTHLGTGVCIAAAEAMV